MRSRTHSVRKPKMPRQKRKQKGAVSIEYGVVVSGLSIALMLVAFGARQDVNMWLTQFNQHF